MEKIYFDCLQIKNIEEQHWFTRIYQLSLYYFKYTGLPSLGLTKLFLDKKLYASQSNKSRNNSHNKSQ